MPRAARKSKPTRIASNDSTADIEIGDVTDRVYPEGVPQSPDGQVADSGTIPIEQAQRIGAVTATAAAANKRVARQVDRASKGEAVSWNEDDPLQLFENIRAAWPGLSVRIFIKAVDTDEVYPPELMGKFKSSADFYEYLLKNVHRNRKSAKYEIMFKAGSNYSNRGKGFIVMPDMSEVAPAAQAQPQWNPYTQRWESPQQPPPYGATPPAFNTPYGYPQQQQPPAQAQAATPNVHIHNPPQPAMPQQPVQQAQPQMMPIPPSMDPNMAQWMQTQIEGQNQLRLQLAEALGAIRDRQANPPTPPSVAPVGQAVPVAPPGYRLVPEAPPPSYQPPPGYRLVPEAAQAPFQGVGAPPPPPPPPPAQQQVQKPAGPLGIDLAGVMGAIQGLEQLRKVVNVGQPKPAMAEIEDDEPTPAVPIAPPAVSTIPLGPGDNPMVYVSNPDGSINTVGMIAGNLHKLPEFFEKMAKGVAAMNKGIEEAARNRPIQANVVENPQMQQRYVPPPPPQRIVESTPQHTSMIPTIPR